MDLDHDLDAGIRELARVLLPDARLRSDVRLIQGIVASIQYDGISVYLGGETSLPVSRIRYLQSYVPVVGDVVWLLRNGPDLFAIGETMPTLGTIGDFQYPVLLNGFTNLSPGTPATPWEGARYWITPDGWVHLHGLVIRAAGNTALPIFNLPVGFRPATTQRLSALVGGNVLAEIDISTNGDVNVASFTVGANMAGYVSLGGCCFPAAPFQDSLWVPLARASSWVQAAAYDGSWWGIPRSFRRDDGWCRQDGIIAGGAVGVGTIAYLVPDDHRPMRSLTFVQPSFNGANQVPARMDIDISYDLPQAGSNVLMSLGALHYFDRTREADWIPAVMQGAWVWYGSAFPPAGYLKDKFGVVHCRGLIKSGVVPSVAFTLPVGYRPLYNIVAITASNNNTGRIDINSATGNVTISAPSSNAYVDLSQIMFRAEQ